MGTARLSIFLLIALVGFPQLSETIYSPILPELSILFGGQQQGVQLTLTVYFIGFAAGTLLWGLLSDIHGRRIILLYGVACYIVASIACLLAPTLELLLLARVIQGIGAASGSVLTQTIIRDVYTGTELSKVFAIIGSALAFSPAIGPILGGLLVETFNVQSVFAFLVLMGLMVWCAAFNALPETKCQEAKPLNFYRTAKRMFRDPWCLCFASLIAGINAILFGFYLEAPFIFVNQLHLSPSQYGLIGCIVASGSFLGARISKRLIEQHTPTRLIQRGIICIGVGSLAWAYFASLSTNQLLLSFTLSIFVIFVGVGTMLPVCISLALKDYRQELGAAGSLLGLTYYILLSLLMAIVSLIHNDKLYPLPIFVLVLAIGMYLLSIYVSRLSDKLK